MSNTIRRSLFIETREWFDKSGGDSYFTARVWVDGEVAFTLPFQYGYGNSSEYEAHKQLLERGYLPQEGKNYRALSYVARDLGIDYYATKSLVNKRDLFRTVA